MRQSLQPVECIIPAPLATSMFVIHPNPDPPYADVQRSKMTLG
jgi:hypothetical protein